MLSRGYLSSLRALFSSRRPGEPSGSRTKRNRIRRHGGTERLEDRTLLTAPYSANDSYSVASGGVLSIPPNGVLANDVDMDGNTLTAQLYMPAMMGTVTLNPNGSFVYTAPSAFTGTVPFYYRAFDGTEFGNMATVNITVTSGGGGGGGGGGSNQPPVPAADSFFVEQNSSGAKLPVLWNDTDPNSNPLSITTVTTPAHGTASSQFDSYTNKSVVSYTPTSGYTGSDNFNYTISDGTLTASTTDTLTIHAVDNTISQARPLALTNNVRLATGGIIGDGPQSWSDVDIFSVSLTAGQGITFDLDSASIDAGGSYGSFNGLLRLFSSGGTQVASNDNGTDPDTNVSGNDPYLSYTVTTSGTYYLGVSDASNSTYNPNTSGGGYGMMSGAYVLQVLRSVPNQAPVATSDSASTHHGTAINIPVLSNDSDPNGDSLTVTQAVAGSHGTAQIGTVGGVSQVRYTPTSGYVGPDSFTYTISDPAGATATATVSVSVTNSNPSSVAESYTAVAGVTRNVAAGGVLTNDTDADSDSLTATLVSGVSHGTLSLNANGSFTYLATTGYSGSDSFVYRAFDGAGYSANTTVALTVYASYVIAASDAYSVGHDKTLTVAAPGLLANDWSYENQPLTAVLLTSPTHGALTLSGNGAFVYVPDSGYVGADSFSYRASNGTQQSSVITVPLSVTNFAPWAVNDLYVVRHDRTATRTAVGGVLKNDVDVEDDALTVSLISGTAHGTLSLSSDGAFSFNPDAGYTGATSFTYRVSDGFNLSQIATATFQVLNNAPDPGEDWFYTPAGQSLVISAADLKSNDVDADNDALTLSVSASPVHGTLTVQPNGDFLYQPDTAWSGTDTFSYTVSDGLATSAPATVSIKVSNSAPIGVSDFYNVRHDRPLVVTTNSVVANDIDDDDDVLSVTLHTAPATGTLVLNSDGTFVYTPEPGATGDVTFKYRVTDGIVTSAPVTATIRITNASPVGRTDSFQIHQGDTLNVSAANGVLQDDTDADNDALTVSLFSGAAHGTLSLNTNGSFSYTPNAGFSGSDSFSYRVTDGLAFSAPVMVSIGVSNSAPVATSNSYSIVHDRIRSVTTGNGVLSNDFDVDSDSLTAVLVAGPSHGTLQLQADGSFTYTPAVHYSGVDSFVYKAFDGSAESDPETVTLTVTNNRPWTVNRSFAAAHDHLISIAAPGLLAFSGDRESDVLSIVAGSAPDHGSLSLNADGSFLYIPDAGFVGSDTFGYKVSDGLQESVEAIVTIRVFNRLPVARTDYYSISHDRPLIVSAITGVLQNDSDLDDDNLTVTLVAGQDPEHGTLSLQSNGSFTYTPAGEFVGTDSFPYRVFDGAQFAEGTVNLSVQNSRPVGENDKYGAVVGQTLSVTAANGVLFNDVDADQDALQAVLVSGPSHGTLSLSANGSFTYTPDAGFIGVDTFRYQAKDSINSLSFVKSVSISTALVAGDDELEVSHDRVLFGDVTDNDHSVPGTSPVYNLVAGPASGTLSLESNGTFTYTPVADFVGEATFTYRFAVNGHYSNTATATISVVNEAPLVFTGTWRASHGKTITATSVNGLAFRSRDRDGDDLTFAIMTQPTHGTLTLNAATGAFTYVPSSGSYTGSDSFQWRAHDGIAWSAIMTGYIELLNRKASLSPDSYETHSGVPLSVNATNGVTRNDYDADGDGLQASVTVLPLHGTITLSGSGAFVYTPDASVINASDSFKYRVWDGADWSDEVTVNIAVTNTAPSSPARAFRTHHGTALNVTAQAGLKNAAVDADGDPLTVQLVTSPSHGTLQLAASGSFVYVPDAGWTGTDSFTWRLSDGRQTSPPIIAQIQVLNNPVDVNDDWFATQRNHAVSITKAQLLRNDADPDDDTLGLSIFTQPTHGTLVLSSAGIWTYTPDENFVGTDTFKYKVNDGASTSPAATVEIDVNNNASQSGDDRFLIPHSRAFTTTTPQILENDYDADGDLLTVSLVTGVSHGTLNLAANGTFTYTPTSGYVGTDSFEYRTSDGVSQGNISLVTFDIRNSAPQIHEQYHRVKHDTVHSVDATSGLRYYSVDPDDDVIAPVILVNPAHGTLNVAANGSWTYTPSAGFVGKDSFTWHAFDRVTYSKPDIVRIEVTNTDSMVTADYYTMDANHSLSVAAPGILKNDLNLDQDALTLSLVENVEHGQLTLNANGSFSYSPAAGFAGEDQFTYRLFDGVSASTGKVTLYVGRSSSGVSQLNVRPDRYQIDALKTLVVPVATGLTANDTFRRAGAAPIVQLLQGPSHGSLTLSSSGSFSYTPTAGASPFVGIDSFTYRLTDSSGQSATATVEIKVENHAPWSTGFLRDVHQGATMTVDASQLASVSGDSEGHARQFSVVISPSHGTLTFYSDGHFSYVPDAGYTGLDSFTWRAFDGIAYSNAATATLDVSNERPTLISNSWRTGSGEQLVVSGTGIRATASDPDGDTLSVSVTQTTQHGTLLVAADGTFTYTPEAGYSGRDTFKARVKDGAEYSSPVTFVIDVENSLPVATGSSATLQHGNSTSLNMAAYDSDGDALIYEIVNAPDHGMLTYTNVINNGSNGQPIRFTGNVTYTPSSNFAGQDELTFRVTDGVGFSDPAEISINVLNTAPSGRPSYHTLAAGQSLTVPSPGLLGQALDADGDSLTLQIIAQPGHGTLTLSQTGGTANGGFSYQPDAGFAGVDSFTWRVRDGIAWSDAVTTTIAVNNTAPVLRDRTFRSNYTSGTALSGGGRRYNYSLSTQNTAFDLENDTVTYQLVDGPAHGTATVSPAGAISYTPTSTTFTGQDSFTVRGFDGYSWSDSVKVSVSVDNEAPLAILDSFTTHHHNNLSFNASQLLGNDYDFDGDTLQIVSVTNGANGTLTQSGNNWVFNPGNFLGKAVLTYVITDGLVQSEPATIEIEVTNAPVWGTDRSFTLIESTYIEFELSGTAGSVVSADGDATTISITAQPAHGSLTSLGDNRWRYTPTPASSSGYNGSGNGTTTVTRGYLGHDQITFRISDGIVQSSPVTYTFNVIDAMALAEVNGLRDTSITASTVPVLLQTPDLSSGQNPIPAPQLPEANAKIHTVRPGGTATGQLVVPTGATMEFWNGTSWVDVTASSTAIALTGGSLVTISPDGNYSVTGSTAPKGSRSEARFRISKNSLATESRIAIVSKNSAPILASPFLTTAGGSLVSFVRDAEGDTISFTAQPGQPDVMTMSSTTLTIYPNGTYVFSYNDAAPNSEMMPFQFTVRDQFGASTTGTLNVLKLIPKSYVAPIPPAGQTDPPVALDSSGSFLASALPVSWLQASDGGHPSMTFQLIGDDDGDGDVKGTYGEVSIENRTVKYSPYGLTVGAFLKEGAEPTTFYYKVTNAIGSWDIGSINIEATLIGGGEIAQFSGSYAVSYYDDVKVAFDTPYGSWFDGDLAANVFIDMPYMYHNDEPAYFQGNVTNKLRFEVRGDILSPIKVSGNADIVSWGGAIKQPVYAGSIRRLIATGGEYIAAFSDSYIEAASQRYTASQQQGLEIETGTVVAAEIGWVSWSILGDAESVRWKAPIIGTSLINSVLANGSLENVITSGGNINSVRADLELNSVIQAGGTIGFGEVLPNYSRSIPEYWVSSRTVFGGSVNSLITAGSHINNVRSTAGDIESIILAGGNIGVVNAEGGRVDSYIGALGRINQVAATDGIDGVIAALLSIGQVWTQASITATVLAGTGITTVEAWNNISGSIRALAGPIRLVSAGTKDSYGHAATGGSISSSVIYAGKSIGSVIARKVINTQGVAPGGNIQVTGGITAGGGYIGQVSAGESVVATVTAVDDIGSVVAGSSITGSMVSQHGSVLTVTATTGEISGQIKGKLNVGEVTAGTDRIGETKAEAGSIGNINATSGKIDGEINGLKGIGNITAGTSILKSITTAGAGASIGHIRAGAATAGNILGAITANGNILSVVATAVKEEELPNALTSTFDWVIRLGVDGTYTKPERLKLNIPKVYADGNIGGTIYAGGGIFDVTAHGRISNDIHADGELPKVLAFKNITADLTGGKGGSTVTTYGELRGDVTIPGNTTVWAYDDVSGNLQIAEGTLNVTTWGSFISESNATGHEGVTVQAYNEVNGSEIKSDAGQSRVVGLDDIDSGITGKTRSIVASGGSVSGSVDTVSGNAYVSAINDWYARVTTNGRAVGNIGHTLRGDVKAEADVDFVIRDIEGAPITGDNVYLFARNNVTAKIVAENGSVYIEAKNIVGSVILADVSNQADQAAVGIRAFGNVKGTTIKSDDNVVIYADGSISEGVFVDAQKGNIDLVAMLGIDGNFRAVDTGPNTGNVNTLSWGGIKGLYLSSHGKVRAEGYGNLDANVVAGSDILISMWGDVLDRVSTTDDGNVKIFARGNVSASVVTDGKLYGGVDIVAGGNITGKITTRLTTDHPWILQPPKDFFRSVSLRALGNISGGVTALNDVTINANNVTGEYSSELNGVNITAVQNVNGKIKGDTNVVIYAGDDITAPGTVNAENPEHKEAGVTSKSGAVTISAARQILSTSASAGTGITAVGGTGIQYFTGNAGAASTITSFGSTTSSSLASTSGDVSAFAGYSADLTLVALVGSITVTTISDLTGSLSASGDVTVAIFGAADNLSASGDSVHVFGHHHADVILTGLTTASVESAYAVSGTLDADKSVVLAGHESAATVESAVSSMVVAGHQITGSVRSKGTATAISESRGSILGGVTATVEGRFSATSVTLGGSVTGNVQSIDGPVFVFAGKNVSAALVQGKTETNVFAVHNVTAGEIKSEGPVRVAAFGNITSKVTSDHGYALVVAGDAVSGDVKAKGNAIVFAVSGEVSCDVESTGASALVVGMDTITKSVKGDRNAIAISLGAIGGDVTATNGSALVVSVAGGVTGAVDAAEYVAVVAYDDISGKITADKSILVASLASVTGEIEAEEYALVLAGGGVTGSSITAWSGAFVIALGNVTSSVTAEHGSVLIITLGNVHASLSATETVAVIALGDVKIHATSTQDLFIIAGGRVTFLDQPPTNPAAAFSNASQVSAASRDLVLVSIGGVQGSINTGRDAVLVSMNSSTAKVTAVGDAIVSAFEGISMPPQLTTPLISAGGDAFLISGAGVVARIIGGQNAMIVSMDGASGSQVTAGGFAAIMTLGTGTNITVNGTEGAIVSTYGNFSGTVTATDGSAVVATIGSILNATIYGKENSLAVTAGSFSGTVTAEDEYAAIISLLNASGEVAAGKGALIAADGDVNVAVDADEDLVVWARGNVNGTYHAGRDAAVVAHGIYDASLSADRDIVFAYAGTSLRGSLTAGRWIGDGSLSVPGDPTEIDDVFSHGEILAQILAGTSASNDPYKGRIGTIGSIGNAGGTYTAQHINRIRTAGTVTATVGTASVAFTGNGGSTGTGSTQILENQATLITDVPRPVLEPSERDEILADAAATKAATEDDHQGIVLELVVANAALDGVRQSILDALEEMRSSIREEADKLNTAVGIAVDSAQGLAEAGLWIARRFIEVQYLLQESSYLTEQAVYEAFRETSLEILSKGRTIAIAQRDEALQKLVEADEKVLQQRLLAISSAEAHVILHEESWEQARRAFLADVDAAGAKILDRIQTTLDLAGFAPGVGAVPDVINAIISAGRGNFGEAALNLAAAVPAIGDALKGGKMVAKGVKAADNAAAIAKNTAKEATDEIVEAGGDILKVIQSTCFAAGTPILTPNGSKRIEDLSVGDEILTRSEHSPEAPTETSRVEQFFSLHANILELKVGGRVIETTSEHPVYVFGKGWVRANQLQPGDPLLGHCGAVTVIDSVTQTERDVPVYNVRVALHHTYFVGDADWGFSIWVHNAYSVVDAGDGTWKIIDTKTGETVREGIRTLDEANSIAKNANGLAEALARFPGSRPVDIRKWSPPPGGREFADPDKLIRHGGFSWDKYTEPIIVTYDRGKMIIVQGMTRVEEALRAGVYTLPAIIQK